MNTVGLIGFGRFGHTLARVLCPQHKVLAYDPATQKEHGNVTLVSLEEVLQLDTIFIAVPIRQFEKTLAEIAPRLKKKITILDVCSVKVHPMQAMLKMLPANIDIIATHPLFGPDSIDQLQSPKIVLNNVRASDAIYQYWQQQFKELGLTVLEMTPEEHDKLVAHSQGITHFIGRVLEQVGLPSSSLNTLGYEKLIDVTHYTCNDSVELFLDMQQYNPYTKSLRDKIITAAEQLQDAIAKRTKE